VLFRELLRSGGFSTSDVNGVVISSVAPALNNPLQELCVRHLGLRPLLVDPANQNIMPVAYRPPSDLGADRIVNAVAAFHIFGGPAIVVDFGTATTFDAVSKAGEYVGGIIAPGIGLSAEVLSSRTARLPRIEIVRPDRLIGDTTVSCMQSGLFFGYVSLVEGLLGRMKEELGNALVIATGGLAPLISRDVLGIDRLEEHLTLQGLRIFYELSPAG
jgi:type III pantothenate kinase